MNTKKCYSDELREMADRMDSSDNHVIQYIHDHFIRPLQESRIFTNNEIAEQLHVSPSQVTKLIRTGKMPTTADGRITEYHLWQYLTHFGKIFQSKTP